jgi:hypothetical protein
MSGAQKFEFESIDARSETIDAALFRETICDSVCKNCARFFGVPLTAIVLTGSVARDEGSFSLKESFWELAGDVEFLLVFEENGMPKPEPLNTIRRRIENDLQQRKIHCTIELAAVSENYFSELPPYIFSLELKRSGRVIWGEDRVLQSIPDFSASDLSKEDAWRLLCNRMIEQFAFVEDLSNEFSHLAPRLQYATAKLYLDMATSYLVFVGAYEATYRQRAEALRLLAAQSTPTSSVPFPLKDFSHRVSDCTDWKISGRWPSDLPREFWEEAIDFASRLWRWEVAQLTKTPGGSSTGAAYDALAQQLKVRDKLRGWASAVVRSGGLKSWRDWPRWVRLGLHATPRYLVYRVGTELFFRLPYLVGGAGRRVDAEADLKELRAFLPSLRFTGHCQGTDWQVLAYEVFNSYSQFVTTTRA